MGKGQNTQLGVFFLSVKESKVNITGGKKYITMSASVGKKDIISETDLFCPLSAYFYFYLIIYKLILNKFIIQTYIAHNIYAL